MEKKTEEQPFFEVRDMMVYRPKYGKDKGILWKDIKRSRSYPLIDIEKVKIKQNFIIREDILEQSIEQFTNSCELIPILLSPDNELLNGYEQYLIAKSKKHKRIAFYPLKLSKGEKYARMRAKVKKRKPFSKAMRVEVFKKCNGKCARCGKKIQIDDYTRKDTYMTIDHIKQHSRGGTDDLHNLQGLCWNCHQNKDNLGKLHRKKKGKNKRDKWVSSKKKNK